MIPGGDDAGHCRRQGDRCCKAENQTILSDSLGRQGGRPCPVMAKPLFLLHRGVESRSPTGERPESPAGALDTGMKTFHEWLAERMAKNESLWLNDKNAVIRLSRLNPLPKNSAVNKSLAQGSAKAKGHSDAFTPKIPGAPLSTAQMNRSTARMLVFPHSSRTL